MDYKEYKEVYQQLLSEQGRLEIGDDPKRVAVLEEKVNKFLEEYPNVVPADKDPKTPFHLLSLKAIFHRTMLVGIDIIQDVAEILSQREMFGSTMTRRRIVEALTKPERRIYFGIWLIFFAMVFFFLDGSS
jgi:hypothetical protein